MHKNIQPVIIIGMHRSGTTMLSQVLEKHGLYQGKKKEENNESTFFIKLNEWILRELGGRWDEPENLVDTTSHSPEHLDAIVRYIEDQLCSPRAIEYLGITRYLDTQSILELRSPWSWKDPRTSLTLDIWLRIFPEAKIIHIIRHGVDVASSLRIRSREYLRVNTQIYGKRRLIYSLFGKRGALVDAPRCLTLKGGFSLWEAYVDAACKYRHKGPQNYIEVKYEELLAEPKVQVDAICKFCGIDSSTIDADYLSGFVDSNKANRFMENQELQEFSELVSLRLSKFGY